MKTHPLFPFALSLASSALLHASAFAAQVPPVVAMTQAECEVWMRERSFANTVASHDAAAFADHLVADTVFNAASPQPVRGRAAVVADWKEIIEGRELALRWHPQFVSIGADPDVAVSSGPAWTEIFDPSAKHRYTISRFNSVWKRDADGEWRVLFDGGTPPKPAPREEVAKLVASLPATCAQAVR